MRLDLFSSHGIRHYLVFKGANRLVAISQDQIRDAFAISSILHADVQAPYIVQSRNSADQIPPYPSMRSKRMSEGVRHTVFKV
jgi:hypothetical protein